MGLFERLRPQPGWKDPDPQVRRAALRQVVDPAVLTELWRTDADETVREEAAATLLALAMAGLDEAAGVAAVGALEDPRLIVQVARSALFESVSRAALSRLHDLKALGSIARHGRHAAALREELCAIALKSPHDDAALSALEHLTGSERFALPGEAAVVAPSALPEADFLGDIAGHGKSRAVVRRARALLHERQQAKSGHPVGPRTDRRAQLRQCEAAESLARSSECEPLGARIVAAQDAWTDLVPNVDDDLDERFQAALRAAREHGKHNLAAREERRLRDDHTRTLRERHVVPRLALIAALDAIQGEDAPRLMDDACWEWNRLDAPDSIRPADPIEAEVLAEARLLSERFDEACKACQCRHEKWLKDREEARLKEADETARRDSEQKKKKREQE